MALWALGAAALVALPSVAAAAAPDGVQTRTVTVDADFPDTPSLRAARSALFDIPVAEDIARRGDRAVRVAIEGRDALLFAIEKPAGGPARLVVVRALPRATPIRASRVFQLSDQQFAALSAEAAKLFDAAAAPPPAPTNDAAANLVVCADGPTTVMEIAAPGHVDRATAYCGELGLEDFADTLAQSAIDRSPGCGAIVPFNDTTLWRLRLCLTVEGDGPAAVEVMNLVNGADLKGHPALADLAAPDVVYEGPSSSRAVGADAFRRTWADLVARVDARFSFERVRGISSNLVRVEGLVGYQGRSGETRLRAPSVQTWRKLGGSWRLVRWVIDEATLAR